MTMRRLALAVFAAGAALAGDPKAAEIAQTMMNAMGGQDAWNKARFVRYDFKVDIGGKTVVDRSHLWDKQTGRYRIDDRDKQGRERVALFNAGTRQGEVYVAGKKLEGAAAAAALKDAYATFINDMYWLAMPWKWTDPGVNLKYLGRKPLDGKPFDVVQLSFDKVGLTPGDRYLAYVSPATHLMEHWEYKLQGGQTGSWDWQYTSTGGVKLASNHIAKNGKDSISMGDVQVTAATGEARFTDPARPLRHGQ